MNKKLIDWLLFIVISVIWGSSFILMKIGLSNHLTPYQVAAVRIVSAGVVMLPVAFRSLRQIPAGKFSAIFLSGVLGSLLPAFLFCVAEEGIDSSLAGVLNALTPIFVIITGALFFNRLTPAQKVVGVIISFSGCVLLLLSRGHIQEPSQLLHVIFVIIATIMYGLNVNIVAKYLAEISSLHIAAIALVLNAVPATIVLCLTGYFSLPLNNISLLKATAASIALGILGTAVATVLFYMLVKRAGGVFASMVTYGIPFVAIGWGIYFQENFGWLQVACLLVILLGVYWANKKISA